MPVPRGQGALLWSMATDTARRVDNQLGSCNYETCPLVSSKSNLDQSVLRFPRAMRTNCIYYLRGEDMNDVLVNESRSLSASVQEEADSILHALNLLHP
jgi:hypothetical protein